MEEVELYFRIKEGQLEIESIDLQIERLKLEKDKISYELNQLDEIYKQNIKPKQEIIEEVKPKKLKKTNDKPSENNIEVQV